MPEEFQQPCSPVAPEPGCTLELPGGNIKDTGISLKVKLQNSRCDKKTFQGEELESVSLKISPGNFDVHPGWNIIDSHYSRGQVM